MVKSSDLLITGHSWNLGISSDGSITHETLTAAAAIEIHRKQIEIIDRLQQILYRLDNLGREGLHALLRGYRAELNRTLKKQAANRAASRRMIALMSSWQPEPKPIPKKRAKKRS